MIYRRGRMLGQSVNRNPFVSMKWRVNEMNKAISTILALVLMLSTISAFALTDTKLEDYTDVMDMTGFFNTSPAYGDENLQHKWLKENLKINIIGSFSAGNPQAQANKLAQMALSGEMPDVVFVDASLRSVAQELIDAGLVAAADDYFDVMPNYLKYREGAINDYWANEADGKHYMLPGFVLPPAYAEELGIGDPMVLGVRQDAVEASGMEVPKTTEEFYNFLKATKENLAGKGGVYEGFIPFGMNYFQQIDDSNANLMAYAFGLPVGGVEVDDENGYIKEAFMTEAWAESERYLAKLYREGLIDPDIFTATDEELLEKGKQGKYGVLFTSISYFGDNIEGAIDRLGIEADYECMDLPGVNGNEHTNWLYKNALGSSIGLVSAKAKDPERIFKYVDWQNTDIGNMITWWGGPDKDESWFYINENGEAVRNGPISDKIQKGEMSVDFISPWTYWIAGLGVTRPSDINASIIDSPGVRKFHQDSKDVGFKQYCNDAKLDAYLLATKGEKHNALWTDIAAIVNEYRAALVMRTADDAEFDEVLAEMYSELEGAGINDVMAENYKLYTDVNT